MTTIQWVQYVQQTPPPPIHFHSNLKFSERFKFSDASSVSTANTPLPPHTFQNKMPKKRSLAACQRAINYSILKGNLNWTIQNTLTTPSTEKMFDNTFLSFLADLTWCNQLVTSDTVHVLSWTSGGSRSAWFTCFILHLYFWWFYNLCMDLNYGRLF